MDTGNYMANQMDSLIENGLHQMDEFITDLDNRIENLELCTQRVNTLKRTKHPKNTTGCAGIKLEVPKDTGRSITYRVSVSPRNGKRISKNFAISVHGLLPAFALAFMWRQNKINELIASDNYY